MSDGLDISGAPRGRPSLEDKYQGCILGLALGDAIGEVRQHQESKPLEEILASRLEYTDDTALALALLRCILVNDDFSAEEAGGFIQRAIFDEPARGYGGEQLIYYLAEKDASTFLEARDKANRAFRNGEGSCGDGAVMRIAPLGLYYAEDGRLREKVKAVCYLDHSHPLALDSCLVACQVLKDALENRPIDPLPYLAELQALCATPEMRSSLGIVLEGIEQDWPCGHVDQRLGNSSRSWTKASSVLGYSLYCYLGCGDDFEKCLLSCLETKGDADTIAAIASSFAGARLGLSGIPPQYYRELENREMLLGLSRELYQKRAGNPPK